MNLNVSLYAQFSLIRREKTKKARIDWIVCLHYMGDGMDCQARMQCAKNADFTSQPAVLPLFSSMLSWYIV